MEIEYWSYGTPWGQLKIGGSEGALVELSWCSEKIKEATDTTLSLEVKRQLGQYFAGLRRTFELEIRWLGSEFQQKVWRKLCDIPYGECWSYRDVAEAIGAPKACRAVGLANNRNPIVIVVPCHRVVGANGKLTGYVAGLEIKQELLKLEQDNRE